MSRWIRPTLTVMALLGLVVGLAGEVASPRPLYDPNAAINHNVSAQLASRVGDIVTIRIVESMVSKKRRTDKTDKSFSVDAPLTVGKSVFKFIDNLGLTGKSRSDITRNKDLDDSLVSTITTRVIEVLPNGNLIVEGKRSVAVGNDNQVVKIRGTVRPFDLDTSNSVASTQVADLEVHAEDTSKSGGLIRKILKFLF